MKKKVILRAPLLSKSGYGVHSRQVFRYLLSRSDIDVYTQCVPWGITPWALNHEDENGLIGEAIKRSETDGVRFDVSMQVQLPNEWDAGLAKYNVGITAGVETDFANPVWTSVHCSKMDLVIVPSQHTKDSLLAKSFTNTEIKVIPESFFDEITSKDYDKDFLNLDTKFNFLTVGVLTGNSPNTDRKNLFHLIKWFLEEFKDDPEVGLIVKTNHGRDTSIDKKVTRKLFKQLLKEVKIGPNPKMYLLHGAMNRKDMTSLYKSNDVKGFLSCTRGEGFGLPMVEAAACDLPVLATDWSAHKEFLNKGRWVKFDYELKPVAPERLDGQIFMDGMQWAEVKEEDFKKKLRKFYKNNEIPKAWAADLGKKIRDNYSWEAISEKYDEILNEVLL